jgi:hypothetical protein
MGQAEICSRNASRPVLQKNEIPIIYFPAWLIIAGIGAVSMAGLAVYNKVLGKGSRT